MGGDLEDRVSGGVDDELAGCQVAGAEIVDDLCAAGAAAAHEADIRLAFDGAEEVVREALEQTEGLTEGNAGDLPVAGH